MRQEKNWTLWYAQAMKVTDNNSTDVSKSTSSSRDYDSLRRRSEDSINSSQTIVRSAFANADARMGVAFGNALERARSRSVDSFKSLSLSSRHIVFHGSSIRLSDSPVRPMTREYAEAGRADSAPEECVLKKMYSRRYSKKHNDWHHKHIPALPEDVKFP